MEEGFRAHKAQMERGPGAQFSASFGRNQGAWIPSTMRQSQASINLSKETHMQRDGIWGNRTNKKGSPGLSGRSIVAGQVLL